MKAHDKKDITQIRKIITSHFSEFLPLLNEHKAAQVIMRKADRKLQSFHSKYQFISDILLSGANDNFLANAVKLLLKDAGFEKVILYKDKRQKPKREDMQAFSGNDIFIIEIKGVSTQNPKQTDLTQVIPYTNGNKVRYAAKNVFGLSIINHNNTETVERRPLSFYTDDLQYHLSNCNVGAISAMDLITHYRNMKRGDFSFEVFKNKLKPFGILTYDSKGGNTLGK